MRSAFPRRVLAALPLALALGGRPANALGPRGTPPPGRPRCIEHSLDRAGNPHLLSGHAVPSYGPGYCGYYVGGGSPCRSATRYRNEGTWGWDYAGVHWPRRVWLGWTHGGRYQGGTGSYRTD